ncbi:hypothetical protein shim_20180 [Shimia sp. SK013]|nr:hypothetical protein shim_20180 [Shimia sp. SK013]
MTGFADAMQTSAATIPVVDISGAISGGDIQGVADAIHTAAIEHGFFYISNHGIDPVVDAAYAIPLARGQLVFYPASTKEDEAGGRSGVAPQTDFGVLTVLLQDNSGGLQMRSEPGSWV